jgi:hypothetical protein
MRRRSWSSRSRRRTSRHGSAHHAASPHESSRSCLRRRD